ncbi:MAG: hypothetical protein ACK5PB_22155 [Pirellula sp.]|jgi:hypothetical protein
MRNPNPYQAPPVPSLDQTLAKHSRSYMTLVVFTIFQILVVLSAHRIWMESPANQYVLLGQSWMEKVLSSIFYSLVFVFLNCTLAWTTNQRQEAIESNTCPPEGLAKNCERLTYVLAASFTVSGISMSLYHGMVHPITPFMVIAGILTVLSVGWFRLEMKRVASTQAVD